MKKGISLITLIITIVVIIVLAGAIVLTVTNNNPINDAKIANLTSSKLNIEDSILLYSNSIYAKDVTDRNMLNNSNKLIFGIPDDTKRITKLKEGKISATTLDDIENVTITIGGETKVVYKLDSRKCIELEIKYVTPPSSGCEWYITEYGQVYLVYEEDKTLPNWITGNPKPGKLIESDALNTFIAKVGWEDKEPTVHDLVPEVVADMFTYSVPDANGNVNITGFNSSYDGTKPDEIKFPLKDTAGNNVIGIANHAFNRNSPSTLPNNVKTIVVPEGYTTVGTYAFNQCTSLKEVYLPSTLSVIYNNSSFQGCTEIEKITVPNHMLTTSCTPSSVFPQSRIKIKEVNFSGEITAIEASAFRYFSVLESIIIPASVTSIGSNAFADCTLLKEVTIPENVESIEANAFSACKNLEKVTFLSKGKLKTILGLAFSNCTALTKIIIPEGVTTVGTYAFNTCTSLKEVYLPSTLTTIFYNSSFQGCTEIEKITVPNHMLTTSYTPSSVFPQSRNKIKEVNFSGEITTIGASAFRYFSVLESIIIPASVTSIGSNAFADCTLLKEVTIPENVESIEANAFSACKNLEKVTFLSKGKLKTILGLAFSNCTALTKIIIPEGVTTVGTYAFDKCTSLKEVYLPSTLTTIFYNSSFQGCTEIEKITVPNHMLTTSYTPSSVFPQSRNKIKEVNFSGEITTIGASSFSYFSILQSITIPSSVTSITSNAFSNCTSLTQIKYSGTATGAPWGATSATVIP